MQAPLIAAGVIDVVVAILKANLDGGTQTNGIASLANLARHDGAAKVQILLTFWLSPAQIQICVLFLYAGYHRKGGWNRTYFGSDETTSRRRIFARICLYNLALFDH
jgi:hypothetical protein